MRSLACVILAAAAACGDDGGKATGDGGRGSGSGSPDAPLQPSGAVCPGAPNTTSPGGAAITIDVDLGKGPLQQQLSGPAVQVADPLPVSPYIYGINNYPETNYYTNYEHTQFGLMRWGGDSWKTYNWMTNAENNGADNDFTNTNQWLPFAYGSVPTDPAYPGNPHDTHQGGGVVDGSDSIGHTQARGAASLVTLSVLDWVAGNASDNPVTYAPSADFVANKPAHAAGGASVYQDDFATFLAQTYTQAPLFFELDNEPNYWQSTHPEVWGTKDLAFDELVRRDVATATAAKAAVPGALVFGPVVAGVDGFTTLDDYGDLGQTNPYVTDHVDAISYYLAHVAAASATAGQRLVDVLDLHYYNDGKDKQGTKKTSAECAQGSRDYGDPTYQTVDTAFDDYIPEYKSRAIIPRMQAAIAASYPGTRLAFTEYNNGCEHDAGGAVAEADTLGTFAAYGVFAATAWPLLDTKPGTDYLLGAIASYRNYDGAGATVGALTALATSSDATQVAAYAFVNPNGATGVQVVAINRTAAPVAVAIRLSNACALASAAAFELSAGTHAAPAPIANNPIAVAGNAVSYTLPAMSVTTFALTP